MMKFFRKHKKAVSPVIAVMLLVAVAVAAVGAYFIWFRSFQTQTQRSVQEQSSGALGGGLQILSITDDGSQYFLVIKNTLGSGNIELASTANVNPGPTEPKSAGTATLNASGTGSTTTLAAGASGTFTLTPNKTDDDFDWTLKTGTTRTFTITSTDGQSVVTTTYTDS